MKGGMDMNNEDGNSSSDFPPVNVSDKGMVELSRRLDHIIALLEAMNLTLSIQGVATASQVPRDLEHQVSESMEELTKAVGAGHEMLRTLYNNHG